MTQINNQKLKLDHEIAVCNRFLMFYNGYTNKRISFIKEGNPNINEPDCICSDNIGIELVGVYDNDYQAQKIWNTARGKRINIKPQYLLLTLQNLENEIGKKLQKLNENKYAGFSGDIILVCNLHSPLIQDKDIKKFISEYVPFKNDNFFEKYFHEIWILWNSDINGNTRIKLLE